MTALLEILLTFVGIMLLLALASQSLLEGIKTALPFQSMTRKGSMQSLLQEAARANGITGTGGEEIYAAVERRLRGLGQDGWWNVRLDALEAADLARLVRSLKSEPLECIRTCSDPETRLDAIAGTTEEWFAMAMDPVDHRYRRRMRVANLVAATVVVLTLNVDAISLMDRARTDPAFRADVAAQVSEARQLLARNVALDSLLQANLATLADTAVAPPDRTAEEVDRIRGDLATVSARLDSLTQRTRGLFDPTGPPPRRDLRWLAGVALSILLISLGAPFWNDLLGSLFGVKHRIQAQAREMAAAADRQRAALPPGGERSS